MDVIDATAIHLEGVVSWQCFKILRRFEQSTIHLICLKNTEELRPKGPVVDLYTRTDQW